MNFKLNEYAEALGLHPRTVLRYLTGTKNPYWTEGEDQSIPVEEVAEVFNIRPKTLIKVLRKRDSLLSQTEAVEFTGLNRSTFQNRNYDTEIRISKIVRYLYSRLVDQHMQYL